MKDKKNSIIKLLFIALIVGLLMILNLCIGGKLNERERSRNEAVYEISSAAGGRFYIRDIFIGIPYSCTSTEKTSDGKEKTYTTDSVIFFQPKSVNYRANIKTQMRQIGIYDSPVFTGDLAMDCLFDFKLPENKNGYVYKFNQAYLRIKLNDKSIISQPEFVINGKKCKTEYAGSSSEKSGVTSYFYCDSGKIRFSTNLRIRGAEEFYVNLCSSDSSLYVESDWVSPGFSKFDYLPLTHDISEKGFTAEWNVPFDAGDGNHKIGFSLKQPVNVYKMLDRAVNYGFLFIIVPFVVLFLFEIFAAINLHPLHYLLCGAASVIFFLLLLSFSEHINFGLAYIISAVASGVLVSLYVSSVTKKIKLGFSMCAVFTLMYGYLFMSLKSEDYALLIGSLFAFVVLASIMFFTRKVDWSNLKIKKIKAAEKIAEENLLQKNILSDENKTGQEKN